MDGKYLIVFDKIQDHQAVKRDLKPVEIIDLSQPKDDLLFDNDESVVVTGVTDDLEDSQF